MKMAPPSQATAYLTAVSLAANLGAGISPLLGGAFVDYFNVRHFEIAVEWVSPTSSFAFPALFLTGYDFLFAMAFVLGLVVLSMLGRVREQGEVDRDVVMDDLIDQTRANLRALNSVPGLSFASHFPVSTIRYAAGIPGLDVAVGVTAYQIASSTRAAVEAAAQSGETARQVRSTVNRAVTDIADQVDDLGHEGVDVALGATLGAMQAVQEAGIEAERVAEAAILGTLEALNKTRAAPLDALRGVTYGVMRGAARLIFRSAKLLHRPSRPREMPLPRLDCPRKRPPCMPPKWLSRPPKTWEVERKPR